MNPGEEKRGMLGHHDDYLQIRFIYSFIHYLFIHLRALLVPQPPSPNDFERHQFHSQRFRMP